MRRREFITLLGGAAVGWPIGGRAQQTSVPVIGFMSSRSSADSEYLVAAFRKGLSEEGYIDGQNVAIEFRWANGQYDQLPALAADLIKQKIAVLAAVGGEPSALAAKEATSTIPIVFTIGGDPMKIGLVASMNRPLGNATGVSLLAIEPEAKRLAILHELVPKAALIAVLINPNFGDFEGRLREISAAARTLGRRIEYYTASTDAELELAFSRIKQENAAALLPAADAFFDTRRQQIIAFAAKSRLPTIYQFREFATAGGLMTYGISITEGYRQTGIYAAQILKGAKPGELPVHQSIKFEFVINLKTAKALDLDVPDKLLALADEVIE
jgi:putative tryptophan/tyrosine transport system substrate-binding protein